MIKAVKFLFKQFTLAIIFIVFPNSLSNSQASPTHNVNPMDFDIAGVKLGMSVDDAIAALTKYNANFNFVKNYWADNFEWYGQTGAPLETIAIYGYKQGSDPNPLTSKYAFLNDLIAEIEPPFCISQVYYDPDPCRDFDGVNDEINDIVQVWFSPVPGKPQVIAIQRTQYFPHDPLKDPTFAITEAALFARYSPDPSITQSTSEEDLDWIFDKDGNLLSSDQIKKLAGLRKIDASSSEGELPDAHLGDGVTVSFSLSSNGHNSTAIHLIKSSLSDGNALYLSVSEGNSMFAAQKTKMIQDATK